MGILDDAIREHLELKRQSGAEQDELRQIEDDAFGPPARPGDEDDGAEATASDPAAEAPTEFMAAEQAEAEAPAEPEPESESPPAAEMPLPPEPVADTPPAAEAEAPPEPAEPDESAEPAPPRGPDTEERHAIAEQPTQFFDVEAELGAAEESPSEEELYEEEVGEPRLGSPEPLDKEIDLSGAETAAVDEDDDFFDEQSLSDELDQALDAPAPAEPPSEEEPLPEEPPSAEQVMPEEPASDEQPLPEEPPSEEQPSEEPPSEEQPLAEEPESGEQETPTPPEEGKFFDQESDDVLEETPDFLQDTPEHDRLWFEQKPPKDFDFDD